MTASHRLALLVALIGSVAVADGAAAQSFVDPVKPWPGPPGGPGSDQIIHSLTPPDARYSRGIRLTSPSTPFTVGFSTGSADLSNGARVTLDQVGEILADSASAGSRILIEGHSDTVGNRDANLALSQQRAAAVQQYLVSKFDIAADRIETIGVGTDHLLVATHDHTPEARNRRVSIMILAPNQPPASAAQPPSKP